MQDAAQSVGDGGELPTPEKLQTRAGALEYVLSGSGAVNIVLLNGAGVTLEGWRALYPAIEELGRVFAWNRFGLEGSDDPRLSQSGAVVVASLRELLAYAGLRPPYVLVGHSLGGLYANLFARLYAQEVAGVMFLEATHPNDREVLQTHEPQLIKALAKVLSVPERVFDTNVHAEIESVDQIAQEIDSSGAFPPVPVTVMTGGMDPPKSLMLPEALMARRAHQRALASLSPHSEQVIAEKSGHFPQLSEPALVVDALKRLVARVVAVGVASSSSGRGA